MRIVVPQGPDESSPIRSAGVGIQKKWRVGTVVKSPFLPLLSATAREFPVVENRHSGVYFRDQLVGLAGDNRAGPQPLLSFPILPTLPETCENER